MGISAVFDTTRLDDSLFQVLRPRLPVTVTFDMADLYNLSPGGTFTVRAVGALQVALGNDNKLTAVAPFDSNTIQVEVGAGEAAPPLAVRHEKRLFTEKSSCTPSKAQQIKSAYHNCVDIATRTREAARTADASLLREAFGKSDQETRSRVVDVFGQIANKCRHLCRGKAVVTCDDVFGFCDKTIVGYNYGMSIVYCDLWFSRPGWSAGACDEKNQVDAVMRHEIVNLRFIRAIQYACLQPKPTKTMTGLVPEQIFMLNNARNWGLFVRSVLYGCDKNDAGLRSNSGILYSFESNIISEWV